MKQKILFVLLLASAAVAATGYVTYMGLQYLVDNIKEEAEPDVAPIVLKEIYTDISNARNSVRAYILTKDTVYLEPYYHTVFTVDEKLGKLKELKSGNIQQKVLIDSIGVIAKKKLQILEEILILEEGNELQKSLQRINEAFTEASKKKTEKKYIKIGKESIEIDPDYKKNKKKILTNFFKFLNKEEETNGDLSEGARLNGGEKIQDGHVNEGALVQDLHGIVNEIGDEGLAKSRQIRERELELTWQGKLLMDKLGYLINRVEQQDLAMSRKRAEDATDTASTTVSIIFVLCVVTMLILFVSGYVLIRYIRKDNAYKRILKTAKNRAEGLAKAKEDFLANMSHEIRTPLNAIIGFGEELETTPLNMTQKDYINTIRLSSDHLLRIINEILDFSKLESGKLQLEREPFSPKVIFHSVKKAFERSVKMKNIQLKVEVSPGVPEVLVGDAVRLKQILINLVGNAIKFTNEGGVKVQCRAIKQNNGHVLLMIKVKDSGIGISMDKKKQIFEAFSQGDNSITREYGGTGLGLAICKRLIEVLDGDIQVHSKVGVGSMFIVSIPYEVGVHEKVKKDEKKANVIDTNKLKGRSILVVDDEQYNRQLMEAILTQWGLQLDFATNGKEAIAKIEQNNYDLVLMDARMPVMSGVEAVEYIRNNMEGNKQQLPIIALTAAVTKEDVVKYQKSGMDDVLPKPFTKDELYRKLLKLLTHEKMDIEAYHNGEKPDTSSETYDVSNLYDLGDGDEGFVREMLEIYIHNTRESLDIIREACESGDLGTIEVYAHKVVAPTRHLGLTQLTALYKKLEKAAENKKDIKEISKLLIKVVDITEAVIKQIEADLKKETI